MASTSKSGAAQLTALFSDLVRCETRLYNALNDILRERHGIVTSQFEFLRYLRENRDARVGDIAATFAIGVGATSKGADRLVRDGWVERRPHPTDRRSSVLELTADGRRLVDDAEVTFDAALADLLGTALTERDQRQMAVALTRLRVTLEIDGIGTPTG